MQNEEGMRFPRSLGRVRDIFLHYTQIFQPKCSLPFGRDLADSCRAQHLGKRNPEVINLKESFSPSHPVIPTLPNHTSSIFPLQLQVKKKIKVFSSNNTVSTYLEQSGLN